MKEDGDGVGGGVPTKVYVNGVGGFDGDRMHGLQLGHREALDLLELLLEVKEGVLVFEDETVSDGEGADGFFEKLLPEGDLPRGREVDNEARTEGGVLHSGQSFLVQLQLLLHLQNGVLPQSLHLFQIRFSVCFLAGKVN